MSEDKLALHEFDKVKYLQQKDEFYFPLCLLSTLCNE